MTQSQILLEYGWLIALTVGVGVVSWAALLLQALFSDQRIAMVGVFGSLLVAFVAVFPELTTFAGLLKTLSALVCAVFLLWFLYKNYNKPSVYLPFVGVLFSVGTGYWLYQSYQAAG